MVRHLVLHHTRETDSYVFRVREIILTSRVTHLFIIHRGISTSYVMNFLVRASMWHDVRYLSSFFIGDTENYESRVQSLTLYWLDPVPHLNLQASFTFLSCPTYLDHLSRLLSSRNMSPKMKGRSVGILPESVHRNPNDPITVEEDCPLLVNEHFQCVPLRYRDQYRSTVQEDAHVHTDCRASRKELIISQE